MNTKLFVLLGGVGAVHLVAGALFITGGCTQEDPPMPPGIYVPRQSVQDNAATVPQTQENAGQADISSAQPAETAPASAALPPESSQPAAAPAAAPGSDTDKVYIVVKNDSLWLIARKHGLSIEELASYNSLSPKAKLRVGQKLHIPPMGKKAVKNGAPRSKSKAVKPAKKGNKAVKAARKTNAKASSKLPADGIYTVKEHDNFSIIAKRFGIKVSDIIAANPGVDSSRLKIGQKLRLTAGAAPVPKSKNASKKGKAKAAKPSAPAKDQAKPADPAPTPEAAPAAKTDSGTADDPEALLNSVKQPQENAAPEKKSETAPAPAAPQAEAAPAVKQDKDRLVKGKNGKLSVILGEDTSLMRFCKKFTVSEQTIRNQNKHIPSDGRLKAGTSILLIGDEDNNVI